MCNPSSSLFLGADLPPASTGGLAQPGTTQLQIPQGLLRCSQSHHPQISPHPVLPSHLEHPLEQPEVLLWGLPAPSCASAMFG